MHGSFKCIRQSEWCCTTEQNIFDGIISLAEQSTSRTLSNHQIRPILQKRTHHHYKTLKTHHLCKVFSQR